MNIAMKRIGSLLFITALSSCGGGGGGDAPPPPIPPSAPTVTLSPNPSTAPLGTSITLSWTSINATSCTATGDWTGARGLSGSVTLAIGSTIGARTYTLTCTGAGGQASDAASVSVTEPPLTADQQAELRRVAGMVRAVVDVITLSARYSRPYIDSFVAANNTDVTCADAGHAHVRMFNIDPALATLDASFTDCVDRTIDLGIGASNNLRITLDSGGVGTWQSSPAINYGDSRFEIGQLSISADTTHGPVTLRATANSDGTTSYGFQYEPGRSDPGLKGPREYCGPHRIGVTPDYGCHYLSARIEGTIDATRSELRMHSLTLSIGDFQSNNSFKAMTLTATDAVVAPILSEGAFATHFDDFTAGTFRYQRTKSAAQSFAIDVMPISSALVRVSIAETNSGSVTTVTRDMTWDAFFANPSYDPF